MYGSAALSVMIEDDEAERRMVGGEGESVHAASCPASAAGVDGVDSMLWSRRRRTALGERLRRIADKFLRRTSPFGRTIAGGVSPRCSLVRTGARGSRVARAPSPCEFLCGAAPRQRGSEPLTELLYWRFTFGRRSL